MNKAQLYWIAQLFGWSTYIFLAAIQNQLSGNILDQSLVFTLAAVCVIGLSVSHLYRSIAIKSGWLSLGIYQLIPKIVVASILLSLPFQLMYSAVHFFTISGEFTFNTATIFQQCLNWAFLLFVWSLFYFAFHFFENYRKEEIKNLQWEATKNEIELNRLKSQLNPHFIFNSMNTIRALVDENPKKSKDNITKLSKILRNTLLSGKKEIITLEEELQLVKDYFDLEQSRFEERLHVFFKIAPETLKLTVPPMMLQTLAENCIKHGISKLPEGGTVEIITIKNGNFLEVTLNNSGKYTGIKTQPESTGLGIDGTIKRLNILYSGNYKFDIFNNQNKVTTFLSIPQKPLI